MISNNRGLIEENINENLLEKIFNILKTNKISEFIDIIKSFVSVKGKALFNKQCLI